MFVFVPPQSIEQLIEDTVPSAIRMQRSMRMDDPVCKFISTYFGTPASEAEQPPSVRVVLLIGAFARECEAEM